MKVEIKPKVDENLIIENLNPGDVFRFISADIPYIKTDKDSYVSLRSGSVFPVYKEEFDSPVILLKADSVKDGKIIFVPA